MDRSELHERVDRIPDHGLFAAVGFLGFLCGSKPSDQLREVLQRLHTGDYGDGIDDLVANNGGLDPWDTDAGEASAHLHLLIDMLAENDLAIAARYLDYEIDAGISKPADGDSE